MTTHLTKSRIILYLAIIFVAGGVTGAVISWSGAKHRGMGPPDPKQMCRHIQDRLQSELDLTPEQVRRLKPLLERRVQEMEAIHSRTVQEIEALIRKSNQEMAVALELTPTQKAKLEEMDKKRQEFMRKHSGSPGPPAGPPPPH
jgi:Spy/CpxP family protein refolding chaperone